jgi:outer membrane immunogenic protein
MERWPERAPLKPPTIHLVRDNPLRLQVLHFRDDISLSTRVQSAPGGGARAVNQGIWDLRRLGARAGFGSKSDDQAQGRAREYAMKKFLQGMIGLAALGMAAPALAADLPVNPYSKAPVMIPAWYDWSGFFVGLNGGGGSVHNCWDLTNNAGVLLSPPATEGCNNATGGLAGGQVGYRWQMNSWVFGVEGQGDWADLRGANTNLFLPGPGAAGVIDRTRVDGLGLFTGQVGYAWDRVLFYVKGGGAVTTARYSTLDVASGAEIDYGTEIRWGGTAGAGVEFSFFPDWSIAFEYDHLFMGTKNISSAFVGNFGSTSFSAANRISQDIDIGTVSINYRWGGPTIAKY